MAYAFAGPISYCVSEVQSTALRAFAARPANHSRGRMQVDAAAFSNTPGHVHDHAPSAAARSAVSPSRVRPSSAADQHSFWSITKKAFGQLISKTPTHGTGIQQNAVAAAQGSLDLEATSLAASDSTVSAPGPTPLKPRSFESAATRRQRAALGEFLAEADGVEVNYAAMLADLSNRAYEVQKISESELRQQHGLQLITTSAACPMGPITREDWSAQVEQQRRVKAPLSSKASTLDAIVSLPTYRQHDEVEDLAATVAQVLAASPPENLEAELRSHRLASQTSLTSMLSMHEGGGLSTAPSSPTVLTPSVSLVALATLELDEHDGDSGNYSRPPSSSAAAAAAAGEQQVPVLTFLPSASSSPSHAHWNNASASSMEVAMPEQQQQGLPLGATATTAANSPTKSVASSSSSACSHASSMDCSSSSSLSPQSSRTSLDSVDSSSTAGVTTSPFSSSSMPQVRVPVVQHTANHTDDPSSPHARAIAKCPQPPAAWFAVDDPVTKIRYFVIQGSTTLEHWQINVQFEPVIWEDPAWGVRVHRGVYQAALQLYDDLLPLVRQHLATSHFASVAFTGHSLGGSLASLIMLIMVARGVLPPDAVSPVYTFGAPAVFCGGADADLPAATRCADCGLYCERSSAAAAAAAAANTAAAAAAPAEHAFKAAAGRSLSSSPPSSCPRPKGLLAQLGLGPEHIINIIMHRDIVPRAFACDYTMVADLLRQWLPSFKDHKLLQGEPHQHKSLYNFLGRISLLQPEAGCTFANATDALHPDLPPAPGLYRMVAPAPPLLRVHALQHSFDLPSPQQHITGAAPACSSILDSASSFDGDAISSGKDSSTDTGTSARPPRALRDAVHHFMNSPHPLTTLSEYAAYGPNGSISRYHNPDNYTMALLSVVHKAPHQLPVVTAPPTHAEAAAACCDDSAFGLDGAAGPTWGVSGACTAGISALAVSAEAQRLVRQSAPVDSHTGKARQRSVSPQHSSSNTISSSGKRAASKSPSPSPATQHRLPTLPGLTPLLSSLLVGYGSSSPSAKK